MLRLGSPGEDQLDPSDTHHGAPPHPYVDQTSAPWPPMAPKDDMAMKWPVPINSRILHLPLRLLMDAPPRIFPASAARAKQVSKQNLAAELVEEFNIGTQDMAIIYMSPDPYHDAFEQRIDLLKFDLSQHPTGGLVLYDRVGRGHLTSISPGSPAARIHNWRSRIRGAWLIKVGDTLIASSADVATAFDTLRGSASASTTILFSHPELRPNLSHDDVPIVSSALFSQNTHTQLNNRWEFLTVAEHLRSCKPSYELVPSGDVLNVVTRVMRLTRGKLRKQPDWDEWQSSEFLQLNQYDEQGMFGQPVPIAEGMACFHSVWTYAIKALDSRKKARWTCDGSPRSGQAKILDETNANCVDQTSSQLFYAVSAAENLLIFGANVSNAFAKAPPPKQGFYIHPDRVFREWWVLHKKRPPIPDGAVIPILSAMQGHPESPRLWEKHADAILRDCGLVPTVHEPCLYSGLVNGNRVIFKCQVDDFAVAAPDERTANILLDMIDDHLTILMKRQGFLDMYNGIDVIQTRYYVKISCTTYVNKICEKYLLSWMRNFTSTDDRPTPLPTDPAWMKKFNSAAGDPDPKVQARLAKTMDITYQSGVGELIWAMTTYQPDMAFAREKLSQANSTPHELHFHGVKHALKYLYSTKDDGLYFWQTAPREEFKEGPLPKINSNKQDLLLGNRPEYDANVLHAYADLDWASCVKTRRSFGGTCIRLTGGTIAYKSKFQPTIAGSSTEAEFMAADDTGKMVLFVRSILWDLDIPQEAATVLYEDNDACTAMGNAQKLTPRTRHIDIKYFSICEWIERDLMILKRIDTTLNMSDHMTKGLHRHADYLLGHVPPVYSPIYQSIVGTYSDQHVDLETFVPSSFTTPMTAAAARVYAPILADYLGNPWLLVLWHG